MGNYFLWKRDFLAHHGIKGQKWGIRRYQNEDGSLTAEGKARYSLMGNEVNRGGIFSNRRKKIDALDLSKEKQMFKEFDADLGELNDKVWDAARNDLDSNKLNNKALNKYLDDHIKKHGDEFPSFFNYGDDEKIMKDLLPNMDKALKDFVDLDTQKNKELSNLTNNLVSNFDRYKYGSKESKQELKRDIVNKLVKDVDHHAMTAAWSTDKEANYIVARTGYLDALMEGYDIEEYIENYGRKKGIEFGM